MTAGWQRGVLRETAAGPRLLVVKLCGSLLSRPGWNRDVAPLFEALPQPWLVVVGGGPLADAVRTLDRAVPQTAAVAHRLAIECMGITARFVADTLRLPLVEEPGDVPRTAVLDVPRWLDRDGRHDRLPVGWHVTSDSIAALVAADAAAGLLLVKSVPPPAERLDRAAAAGWIDGHFPTAARHVTAIAWAAPG